MDVEPVVSFVEHDDGNVGERAEVDEVLDFVGPAVGVDFLED